MSDPVPIKKGIDVQFDVERELMDFFAMKLRNFRDAADASPPEGVAIVLLGKSPGDRLVSIATTWSPSNTLSLFEISAMGAALLTKRATE